MGTLEKPHFLSSSLVLFPPPVLSPYRASALNRNMFVLRFAVSKPRRNQTNEALLPPGSGLIANKVKVITSVIATKERWISDI